MTVMLGIGGILAEATADVVFRLAPISGSDAEEMIADLRFQSLLGPVRGEPAADRVALVGVLLALSRAAADDPELLSVDLNPVILEGSAPLAVDALVELAGEAA